MCPLSQERGNPVSGDVVRILAGAGYSFETLPGADLDVLLNDLLNRINQGVCFNLALFVPGEAFFLTQPQNNGICRGVYYQDIDCLSKDSAQIAATLAFHAGAGTRVSVAAILQEILGVTLNPGFQHLRIVDMGTRDCRFWRGGSFLMEDPP